MNMKSSSIASFLLLLYTLFLFPLSLSFFMKEKSILIDWTFTEINSCHMNMTILLDSISLSFSNVVCFISGCVLLFSSSYMSSDPFLKRFTWLVMLFVMSMNLLVFIPSLPALLLGWDGLGITSFALVIYYQNNKSLGAGMLTLLTNRIGDVMILLSIGLLVLIGNWNISLLWDFPLLFLLVIAIMLAGMTKSAQMPFSSWLPAAMAAPTPVSALVHSSTLVTAGVFLLIRFYPTLSASSFFEESLMFVAVLTLLMAGIGANFENDLKKVIALSTLSQLGVMMMSLSMNLPNLALFHLYTHALFKALLFLCAGAIIHGSNNNQDIRKMGLISKQLPLTTTCMNIANLSLCGAPFLSGFYSKDLILEMALIYPTNYLMILMTFVATGMTAAYTLRLSFSLLWGTQKSASLHSKHEADSYVNISTCALAIMAIISGMFLQMVFLPFEMFSATLSNFQKSTTMLVIMTSIFISLFFWKLSINESMKFKAFCSSMWFLVLLSTQPAVSFSSVFGSKLMKTSDQGWMEILGGQGAWKGSNSFSIMIQSMRSGMYINMIFVSLISIFLILLISYLL
ncbi:NADH dehydrogenase subunit 5 (mitochondrion) [Pomacea canaliculata]|uniref:NADH-ubiquinone oxidoreductase chain 5 n=2 Tax=Pomacea canaliculata TaxID=400727 RepID=A0A068FLH0_POMCA|nr:NADH dehydrogenase subunit 5 [Pomacea canaliculata]AID68206.1 NADH dehydrogenase subunit 5 [Pomacea canaliculata]ANM47941.1 NADH dehydrogenase subunit 5 [Pomacea canaliculata]ART65975.1 NADH dehydrogenase subunit 5 [Pomacea canaliculata]